VKTKGTTEKKSVQINAWKRTFDWVKIRIKLETKGIREIIEP